MDINSRTLIKYGRHSSVIDTTDPASTKHYVDVTHDFKRPGRIDLDRPTVAPANEGLPPFAGPIDVSQTYTFATLLKGLNGNNGAAIDPAAKCECTELLDTVAGTDSIDPAGAASAATGGNGATKILGVAERDRFPVGTVVLFTTTDAGVTTKWYRQVRANGGSGAGDLTLDRVFTGTVDAANVVRAARWIFDPSVYEHTLGGFDVERFGKMRTTYYGGMATAELDFENGKHGRLITKWKFTDIQPAAPASPTLTKPTNGNAVVRNNNSFWIGDTQYYSHGVKVDCGGVVVPAVVDAGPQGFLGFTVQKGENSPRPKISGMLQEGTRAGEVSDNGAGNVTARIGAALNKNAGDEKVTFDALFASGAGAGGFCVVVAPAMHFSKWEHGVFNGYNIINFEATCWDDGSASLYPLEVHLG